MIKPLIAVTASAEYSKTAVKAITKAVESAGGNAIIVTPDSENDWKSVDAFIFSGGADIGDRHFSNQRERADNKYKQSLFSKIIENIIYPLNFLFKLGVGNHPPEDARDRMEIEIAKFAIENSKPILGICRGHQLINLILGGILINNIRPLIKDESLVKTVFPRKKISVESNSKLLSKILSEHDEIKVNAIHSQAITNIGDGMTLAAIDDQGLIQAAESAEKNILTVQWHPEYLRYRAGHQAIFYWLINSARIQREKHENKTA